MTVRGYMFGIDWSDAGTYAGPLEDVSSYVDRGDITLGWGRTADDPTALTAPESALSFTLRNRDRAWDRYFSPENTSSPIAGKILPEHDAILTRTVAAGPTMPYSESFSVSVAGWAAVGGGTLTRQTGTTEDGNGALQYVPPGAVASVSVQGTTRTPIYLLPQGSVMVNFRMRSSAGWSNVNPLIDWYDAAGAFISSSGAGSPQTIAAATWTTVLSASLTPPVLAAYATPRLNLAGTPPNTNTFHVDSVTLMHTADDAGKTYVLKRGVLDDLDVDSNSVARTFTGSITDAVGREDDDTLSTPVLQGVRTGEVISYILDQIGWPAERRAIDPGATLIRFWWEEGTDIAAAIDKVVASEGPPAIAYVEGGIFTFRDRHHRVRSAASQTSQGIVTHTFPAGPQGPDYKVKKDSFLYNHGVKNLINSASFSVDIRQPTGPSEVWVQEDPVSFGVGESQVFYAQPSDPVINALEPSTAEGTIVGTGTFTATLSRTSGASIAVTVTNSTGGVMTRLALMASPLEVKRTAKVTASVPAKQRSAWPGDAPWAGPYDAQVIANRIVALYADYRPRVTFTLVNFNDRYLSKILSLRISDRITVKSTLHGVDRDFYVERVEHTISRLLIHEVTVTCVVTEPAQAANPFTFGVAGKGFNDGVFAVDGIDNAASMFIFDTPTGATQGFGIGQFAN